MSNYKQYPLETVEMMRAAVKAMLDASEDDKFLEVINNTENFPVAQSLDDMASVIDQWADDIIRKYQWQPLSSDEITKIVDVTDYINYFVNDLFVNSDLDLNCSLCEIANDWRPTRDIIDSYSDAKQYSAHDTLTHMLANLAHKCSAEINEQLNKPVVVKTKTIDRISPMGHLQLAINSLRSLTGKWDNNYLLSHAIVMLNTFTAEQKERENDSLVEDRSYCQRLVNQGWSEVNTGGGTMVWFKDFQCFDGNMRMVGIDGENPTGCIYGISRSDYDNDDGEYDTANNTETEYSNMLYEYQKIEIVTANSWVARYHGCTL